MFSHQKRVYYIALTVWTEEGVTKNGCLEIFITFEHSVTENLFVLILFVRELWNVCKLPAKPRAHSISILLMFGRIQFVLLNAVVHRKVILNSGAGKTSNSKTLNGKK